MEHLFSDVMDNFFRTSWKNVFGAAWKKLDFMGHLLLDVMEFSDVMDKVFGRHGLAVPTSFVFFGGRHGRLFHKSWIFFSDVMENCFGRHGKMSRIAAILLHSAVSTWQCLLMIPAGCCKPPNR